MAGEAMTKGVRGGAFENPGAAHRVFDGFLDVYKRQREDGAVLAKGVRAGELVVTVGAHKLVAGQSVRPIVQETPAAGKPL